MYDFYKKCEESLKNIIIQKYGNYLTKSKIKKLNKKEYITDEVLGIKKLNDLFNYLTDKILDDLLDLNTVTKHMINNDTLITIPCGNTLKRILKSYYKIDLSRKLSFNPLINYSYSHDLDIIEYLNEEYNGIINKNVFSKNVIELSLINELTDYVDETIIIDTNEVLSQ